VQDSEAEVKPRTSPTAEQPVLLERGGEPVDDRPCDAERRRRRRDRRPRRRVGEQPEQPDPPVEGLGGLHHGGQRNDRAEGADPSQAIPSEAPPWMVTTGCLFLKAVRTAPGTEDAVAVRTPWRRVRCQVG
jgi:hypothetical protein